MKQLPTGRYALIGLASDPIEVYLLGPPDRWKGKRANGGKGPYYFTIGTRAGRKYPIARRARCDDLDDVVPADIEWIPDVCYVDDKLVPWDQHEQNVREYEAKQREYIAAVNQVAQWYCERFEAVMHKISPPLEVTGQFVFDNQQVPCGVRVTTKQTLTLEEAEKRLDLTPPPRPDVDETLNQLIDKPFMQRRQQSFVSKRIASMMNGRA